MDAYSTGSDPIEIGDLGFKVKVTVTENLSKNDEKIAKISTLNIFDRTFHCRHFDTKYDHIVLQRFLNLKEMKRSCEVRICTL